MHGLKLTAEKQFYLLALFSIFVLVICSVLSADGTQTSQFSALPKKLLSRHQDQKDPRLLEEEAKLIGIIDTFAYVPKFLKVNVFEIPVKDRMLLQCYSNGKCSYSQTIQWDNATTYNPQVEALDAARLVPIWKALSLLNVLVLRKQLALAGDLRMVFEDLKVILEGMVDFRGKLIREVQEFLNVIVQVVIEQISNLNTTVLLNLDDANSDLSLQFQNILANSFSIIVGKYLQVIAADFLFFDRP